jgi:hypothetical protein
VSKQNGRQSVPYEAVLADYLATATAWDRAQGDPEEANRLFDRLHRLAGELKSTEDGRRGIAALIHDPSVGVRLIAASDSLAWAEAEAIDALEQIEVGRGLHAVSAKYTLMAFRGGRLNTVW